MVLKTTSSWAPLGAWKMFDSYSTRSEMNGEILKPGRPRSGQRAFRSTAATEAGPARAADSSPTVKRKYLPAACHTSLSVTNDPPVTTVAMIGDRRRACQITELLGPLQHPPGRVLSICEPESLPELDLQRVPFLFVDLGRPVLRALRAAHVAPPVRLERAADGGGEAVELEPSPVHVPARLDVRRLDDGGLVLLIGETLGHRDVLELAADGTRRIARTSGQQHGHGERGGECSQCHARILTRCAARDQEIWRASNDGARLSPGCCSRHRRRSRCR